MAQRPPEPGKNGKIMLSLVSRQVWPQMLAVAYLRPEKLYLLHTSDGAESQRPARRLRRFFQRTRLLSPGHIRTIKTAHDDFAAVQEDLGAIDETHRHCLLNFTGGNKLMAAAAFDWARLHRVPAFYLERGYTLCRFDFDRQGTVLTSRQDLPVNLLNHIDPLELIRCHLDSSEIESEGELLLLRPGAEEKLKAVDAGRQAPPRPEEVMQIINPIGRREGKGNALELMTAFTLLSLGVYAVRRGIRLKPKSAPGVSSISPHTEIDLVFNHNGRIWIVDCKDRADWQWIVEAVETGLFMQDLDSKSYLVSRIRDALYQSEFKHLKQDIYSARELGGINAGIICVRRDAPSPEELQYAQVTGVEVVVKRELTRGLARLIQPERENRLRDSSALDL